MVKFKKEPWVKPFPEKLAKRVSKIPTGELEMWVEQSITEVYRCMSMYSRKRDEVYINEAAVGAEALHAVLEELKNRMTRTTL